MKRIPFTIQEIEAFNLWALLLNFIFSLESEFKKALQQQLPGVKITSRITDTNKFIKNRKIDLGKDGPGLIEIYFSATGGKKMRVAIYNGVTKEAHIELVENEGNFHLLSREHEDTRLFDPNQIETAAQWITKGTFTKFAKEKYREA